MIWLGVGSQTFLPRIGAVTGAILQKTTENVPFQVRGTAPLNQHPTSNIQDPAQEIASVR